MYVCVDVRSCLCVLESLCMYVCPNLTSGKESVSTTICGYNVDILE